MYLIGCVEGSIWGFIYDELEFRKILMLVNCLTMLNSFLIKFTSYTLIIYAFSIILNEHLKIGAFIIIYPYVSRIFGFKYAGEMFGVVVLLNEFYIFIVSFLLNVFGIINYLNFNKNYIACEYLILGDMLN